MIGDVDHQDSYQGTVFEKTVHIANLDILVNIIKAFARRNLRISL